MTGIKISAAACALLLCLTGCGGYKPDMSKIETDLAGQIKQQDTDLINKPTVDCPASVNWEPGSDFHCTVDSFELINPPRVTVSMENAQGEYTWDFADLSGDGPT